MHVCYTENMGTTDKKQQLIFASSSRCLFWKLKWFDLTGKMYTQKTATGSVLGCL